ncbi:Uncharacterised protein [Mycobacteroides abscessus subsp. abscessus]|nr:Uncharacterised protein [Mycobacteroides abscessus subsp. abscessus]
MAPSQACASSDSATPASTRSIPKRQVLCRKSTPYGARCSGSKPHRMFASRTHAVIALTCRAVAGMHLHRMIVRRERPALGTHLVGRQVGLQPTQQRV